MLFRKLSLLVFLVMATFGLNNAYASSDTREIIDASGNKLNIPLHPKRVIALTEFDLDASLALGIQPIGTVNGRGQNSAPRYLGQKVTNIPIVGKLNSPIMGKVISLKPDVILFGGIANTKLIKQLNMIAPTIVTFTIGQDWKTAFQQTASYLNRKEEGSTFLANYNNKVNALKTKLGDNKNKSVSVVRWNPKGPAYMLKDSFARKVLSDLELKTPSHQNQKGISHSPPISLEDLKLIDSDWVYLGTLESKGKAYQAMNQVKSMPAYQGLSAYKSKKIVPIDGSLWTSLGGPIAAIRILDDVETSMSAK